VSYAAVSTIATPPDTALSGLSLAVQEDTGARFPAVPFEALIWPVQERPVIGGNACRIQVTAVDGDAFTFTRDSPTIEILAGMQIAVLHAQPVYQLGEQITIADTVGQADGPYTYAVQSPSGALGGFGTQDGMIDDGGGSTHFTFTPDRGGQWRWRLLGQTKTGSERAFFVIFSDTIS
jgi:hypothetical protein